LDTEQKLELLAAEAIFDRAGASEDRPAELPPCDGFDPSVPAALSQGKSRLFKVLQSSECVYDCSFCPLRSGRDTPRATVEPEELAGQFHRAHAAGFADGLYLTSGVRESGVASMDAMLKTADILRNERGYAGYLHLKILPEAQRAQVQAAMELADRVSLNLEAPTEAHLEKLSGRKHLETDLLERLGWIRDLRAEFPLKAGVTIQFVVGAAGETDRELMTRSVELYQDYGVSKVHYAGFKPVIGTPLEHLPPTPRARENRLFQADLLQRAYGIVPEELAYGPRGYLWLSADPKMVQALSHPENFPVEVNTASYEELIRVPGIGLLSAKRLLSRRRERLIRSPREIALCGAVLKRAAPFLLLDGRAIGHLEQFIRMELRKADNVPALQLSLFPELEN
jgi:predicted DNA-binding helix-hairpin-helix protein